MGLFSPYTGSILYFDHPNIPNGSPFGKLPMRRGPFFPQGIN